MINKADILARLASGETMDAIAAEITETLNAAEAEYIAEREEAARQEAEIARVQNAKRAAIEMIVDGFCDYLVAIGEDELLDEMHEVDFDEMINSIDSVVELARSMQKLKDLQFDIPVVEPKNRKLAVEDIFNTVLGFKL